MKRLIGITAGLAASLLLLGLIALIWLIGTHQGSAWVVDKGIEYSGQDIEIDNLSGRLLDRLSARKVSFHDQGTEVQISGLTLDYSLIRLLGKKFIINRLEADSLEILIPENRNEEPSPLVLPEFSTPITVFLDRLDIKQLQITTGDTTTRLQNLRLKARLQNSLLTIEGLHGKHGNFDFDARDSSFRFAAPFPLKLTASAKSTADGSTINIQASGEIAHYSLSAQGDIQREEIPEVTFRLTGRGDLDSFTVEEWLADTLEGTLAVSGDLNWKDQFNARLKLSGKGINPGLIATGYEGAINFQGDALIDGNAVDAQLQMAGKIRNYPFQTTADFLLRDGEVDIRKGDLSIGSNHVKVHGKVTREQAEALAFGIDAPDLSLLYPELQGSLTGSGTADGKWLRPKLNAVLKGQNINWQTHHTDAVEIKIVPQAGSGQYHIEVQTDGIRSGANAVEHLSILADGSLEHQQIKLHLTGGPYESEIDTLLKGDFDTARSSWKGIIQDLHFTAKDLPDYRQTEASRLLLSNEQQKLDRLCLLGPKEKICLTADIKQDAQSDISAQILQLPLKRFSPWAPLTGEMPESLDVTISATGLKEQWSIDAGIEMDSSNRFTSKIRLQTADRTLDGNINAQFNKLDWVTLITDQVVDPKGELIANLSVGGTLDVPDAWGRISLQDGLLRLPASGTELRDIALSIDLKQNQTADINGKMNSAKGAMGIKGEATWTDLPRWSINLDLTGEEFEIVNIPLAKVATSLDLKIAASEKQVNVTGEVAIPEAEISLGDLPEQRLSTSEDEIIISKVPETEPPKTKTKLPVHANIVLKLGDRVHLSGYGLDALLAGILRIDERPGQVVQGHGTLKVIDGTYQAYGQDLVIETGEIYFNGPLDAPRINLRAIRDTGEVVAGLQIRGTLDAPESSVFSTPPLPQTEAMAYLFTGKSLDSAGEGDANMLVSAATSLGLKQSEGFIEEIRTRTGFDTLEIDAGQDASESSLLVGKYLSPKLYIQYAVKLFEEANVFSLRYELNKRLYLEAESGESSQGIDLIYQIEK